MESPYRLSFFIGKSNVKKTVTYKNGKIWLTRRYGSANINLQNMENKYKKDRGKKVEKNKTCSWNPFNCFIISNVYNMGI